MLQAEDSLDRARRLIAEGSSIPHWNNPERYAWAMLRERELTDCLREFVSYHESFADGHTTLAKLALALLKSVEPLFCGSGPIKAWADKHLLAPYRALKAFFEPPKAA